MTVHLYARSVDAPAPFSAPVETHPCQCSADHQPNPVLSQLHHIVPLGWSGPDTDENKVPLCGTAHDSVHWLLRAYERAGGEPEWSIRRRVGPYIREVARQGWEER